MTPEELQKIIDQFDEHHLKRQAVFGIFTYGGGSDESFIRANKEGLELFALNLLKSARETDATLANIERNTMPFDYEEDWIDDSSDTFIQYIEPTADNQKIKPNIEHKTTITERLMPFGCGLMLIVLAISAIVGIVAIFKWVF